MMQYKNIKVSEIAPEFELDELIDAVANALGITLPEAESLITEYQTGQTERDELLAEIASEVTYIDGEVAWLNAAIPQAASADLAQLRVALGRDLTQNRRQFLEIRRIMLVLRYLIKNVQLQ